MNSQDRKLILLMIFAMVVWGLSWPNGKILGQYTTPETLMTWRFMLAAVTMVPVLLYNRLNFKLNHPQALTVVVAAVLISVYNWSYFTGTHISNAGAGGVLVTTLNPVFTVLLVSLVHRIRPTSMQSVGILLGLVGGAIMILDQAGELSQLQETGTLYFVVCAISWAILTLVSAYAGKTLHSLQVSFWIYTFSAILVLIKVPFGSVVAVFQYDVKFWVNLLAVSIGAMAFATTAYFIAASRLGSSRTAAFTFTVPVSAMGFSMILLGETLTRGVAIGGTISILAVYIINRNPAPK